jgi:hypothetical protein
MNAWGIDGCEANRDAIIEWLQQSAAEQGWIDKAKAGTALLTKSWFRSSDAYNSILDEALRRAKVSQVPDS